MKLKTYIKKDKLTYKKVAQIIGCSPIDVYRYCAGISIPRADRMSKIIELTNGEVQPNDFYEEK